MCLAVPGELMKVDGNQGEVNFSGVSRRADLRLVPGAKVGDYLLVHAGCAIQIVPADEALETLKLFQEMMGEEATGESLSGAGDDEGK
ncbi:MAG TPA: HypC/HybG/HupF family hydrogenase formation chaperone [Firmicutes bacterium]|jgi:hydrogenase expression/formation protein HypC|nr:HypC/HybG/HupF family hydrogenase formation chaperone [Bacillota bacterium]